MFVLVSALACFLMWLECLQARQESCCDPCTGHCLPVGLSELPYGKIVYHSLWEQAVVVWSDH